MVRLMRRQAACVYVAILGFLALSLGFSAGCVQRNAYVPPPPPDVVVGQPIQQAVTIYSDFTGTTQASEMVEVRSRVQGYLDSIYFADGTDLRQGDLLFLIDPRPYQATLDQAKANLESKKAAAVRDEALYQRTLSLYQSHSASKEDVDNAKGTWAVAQADVLQAQANLWQAQLNLDFTKVHAPITGRISRRLVDAGNLVLADSTLLTTIARYDPMYVYFTVSETDYLRYLKRNRERPPGSLEASIPQSVAAVAAVVLGLPASSPEGMWPAIAAVDQGTQRYPVEMGLANEGGYPHKGVVDFADNTIDPGTGTLQIRATFPNPEPYYLGPGLFVRLRVPIGSNEKAILVPDLALGVDQGGQYLLVVKQDNVVEHRPVKVGELVDIKEEDRVQRMRVIEEGLQIGERFVVDGLQKARPGSKVNPKGKDEG